MGVQPLGALSIAPRDTFSLYWELYGLAPNADPVALLRTGRGWRLQPAIAEGTYRSLTAGVRYDTTVRTNTVVTMMVNRATKVAPAVCAKSFRKVDRNSMQCRWAAL